MWEAQYYKHDDQKSLITSGGLGTMGFALPAAIGAKLACPDKEVWVVAGDGGFQMNMQELMTFVQEGIKVNIAVINNGYLGMVRQWQELFYQRRYAATPMLNPDFVQLAEAFGIPGRDRHRPRRGGRRHRRGPASRRPLPHRVPGGAGDQRVPHGARGRQPPPHAPARAGRDPTLIPSGGSHAPRAGCLHRR